MGRLIVILGLLSISSSIYASTDLQKFCNRPYELICSTSSEKKQSRDERHKQRKNEIKQAAIKYVLERDPKAKVDEIAFDDNEFLNGPLTKSQRQLAKLYFEGVYQALKKMIGNSYVNFKPAFTQVQKFLVKTVKERVSKAQPSEARQMVSALQTRNVTFIDAMDALKILQVAGRDQTVMIDHINQTCGRDGLKDNADATFYPHSLGN